MRLICSPALTPEDFAAMKEADQVGRYAQSTVRADLEMLLARPEAVPATKLLATLIANGIIDVRIAFADHPAASLAASSMTNWASSRTMKVSASASSAAPTRHGELGASTTSLSMSFVAGKTKSNCSAPVITPTAFRLLWRGREPGVRTAHLEQVTQDQLAAIADDDLDHAIQAVRSHQLRAAGCKDPANAHGTPAACSPRLGGPRSPRHREFRDRCRKDPDCPGRRQTLDQ